ncbi:DOC family protein [Trematosphaeria pertusa]|uniref:DOC family protein n=1 Tax=Trematosphaeria pertusa TaxID=390896 RepID=A0A6A6HUH6_9PLEO|nr:DOC family protein [Trematosphaeria pertusa]KAF2241824.1 DOC family protein [Trematosphaeria pertusa]
MASKTYRFLSANQVQRLYTTYIANTSPSQPALLESAITSPMNIKHYGGQQDLFVLAGELATKIMKNHAFPDGNKRIALVAADRFLKMNGYRLQRLPLHEQNNIALEDAHVKVVENKMSAEELGKFYASIATAIEEWTPDIIAYRNEAIEC